MGTADFSLAPPPTPLAGVTAVPIDIDLVDADVTFDLATSVASVDATVTWTVGPWTGSPLFDLRQTITTAWLDGAPLAVSEIVTANVTGDPLESVRVMKPVLAAGSTHTLRLQYALDLPHAQLAGAYPPVLSWLGNGRVRWSIGLSDLNAGRYLEAWLPANLLFDQFAVALRIRLSNSVVPHALVTNGVTTSLGTNHWSVAFGPTASAMTPLVELREATSLEQDSLVASLPSGATVGIEVWKRAGGPEVLATEAMRVRNLLLTNENVVGPFTHGGRFVVFFHGASGGMEYDGATTTDTGSLGHEVFHSWFGRGVKPGRQADGWWDEGYATYRDAGGTASAPLDFTAPPTTLCSRDPFQRRTPMASYAKGYELMAGIAAMSSPTNLALAMGDFYRRHRGRVASTMTLEAHLVSRIGVPTIVDAFHRFVYGFGAAPAPDLWLRDDAAHIGGDAWNGPFWNSPDVWVRHDDDGGVVHQAPQAGRDNWFHARVRNVGTAVARHFVVTFAAQPWLGTEFTYPSDFLPCTAAAVGFDLGPGEERVVSARWPADLVPPTGTHTCILASALTPGDHPAAGRHVWEHGNLAQRNTAVVAAPPGAYVLVPVVVRNVIGGRSRLVVRAGAHVTASLHLRDEAIPPDPVDGDGLWDCGGHRPPELRGASVRVLAAADAERHLRGWRQVRGGATPIRLDIGGQVVAMVAVRVPSAVSSRRLTVELLHLGADDTVRGGVHIDVVMDDETSVHADEATTATR